MFPHVSVEVYGDRRLMGVRTTESNSRFTERALFVKRRLHLITNRRRGFSIVRRTMTYSIDIKFELSQMHQLDTSILLVFLTP